MSLLNQLADEFAARQRGRGAAPPGGVLRPAPGPGRRHPVAVPRPGRDWSGPRPTPAPSWPWRSRTSRRSLSWATSACSARSGAAGWASFTRPSRCRSAGGWPSSSCRPRSSETRPSGGGSSGRRGPRPSSTTRTSSRSTGSASTTARRTTSCSSSPAWGWMPSSTNWLAHLVTGRTLNRPAGRRNARRLSASLARSLMGDEATGQLATP